MEEGATVSNQKTVYQTYVIRFPRRTDLGSATYLLQDAGGKGYRSFTHLETLLDTVQKELTPPSRERNRGLRHVLKDSMDGLSKYFNEWGAFWKRKAVVAPAEI
jgi:hypothetical protein